MSQLEVEDLFVSYSINGETITAVSGISFAMDAGEIVGLVGESGCGKTSIATALLRLDPAQSVEGRISFDGKVAKPEDLRGHEIAMVFQNPMTSLNPTLKIGKQIAEGMIYHRLASRKQAEKRAIELLELVGIPDPHLRAKQYPHTLSGGMRQRVGIAIALAMSPKLIIADEPTTALDPTISAQILDLLKNLVIQCRTSLLLITHDLRAVASICSRVLVMCAGKIIESGSVEEIFYAPKHPYTKLLLQSLPSMRPLNLTK